METIAYPVILMPGGFDRAASGSTINPANNGGGRPQDSSVPVSPASRLPRLLHSGQ